MKVETSLEIRRRLELLLARLDALQLTEESLRTMRAIETLEHSATSESIDVLELLVKSAPEIRLAVQAEKALARFAACAGALKLCC